MWLGPLCFVPRDRQGIRHTRDPEPGYPGRREGRKLTLGLVLRCRTSRSCLRKPSSWERPILGDEARRQSAWPSQGGEGYRGRGGRGRRTPSPQEQEDQAASVRTKPGKGCQAGGATLSSQLGYLRVGEGPGVLQGDGTLSDTDWSEVLRGRNTQAGMVEGGAVTCLGTRSLPRTTAVTNSLEYSMASSLQGKPRRHSGRGGHPVPTLLGSFSRLKAPWGGHRCQAGLPAPIPPFLPVGLCQR